MRIFWTSVYNVIFGVGIFRTDFGMGIFWTCDFGIGICWKCDFFFFLDILMIGQTLFCKISKAKVAFKC